MNKKELLELIDESLDNRKEWMIHYNLKTKKYEISEW